MLLSELLISAVGQFLHSGFAGATNENIVQKLLKHSINVKRILVFKR